MSISSSLQLGHRPHFFAFCRFASASFGLFQQPARKNLALRRLISQFLRVIVLMQVLSLAAWLCRKPRKTQTHAVSLPRFLKGSICRNVRSVPLSPNCCARDFKPEYGLTLASAYRWISQGTFPAPVNIDSNSVAWHCNEIKIQLQSRPRAKVKLRQTMQALDRSPRRDLLTFLEKD